jgi:hypothetical protein
MLDYSGTLLWGLQQMDRQDILAKLRRLACDPTYQPYVEWLGTCWGHAVVPIHPCARPQAAHSRLAAPLCCQDAEWCT